jgi:hypothetical protein
MERYYRTESYRVSGEGERTLLLLAPPPPPRYSLKSDPPPYPHQSATGLLNRIMSCWLTSGGWLNKRGNGPGNRSARACTLYAFLLQKAGLTFVG